MDILQVHAVNSIIMDISNYTDFTVAQHPTILTTDTVIAVLDVLIKMEVSYLIICYLILLFIFPYLISKGGDFDFEVKLIRGIRQA